MPRARGEDPSKLPSLRRLRDQLNGPFPSTFDYVEHASYVYSVHGKHRALFDSRRSWYQFMRRRPCRRSRTSGPVGPELDTSVVNSDVSFEMLKHLVPGGRAAYHIFPARRSKYPGFGVMANNHGCVQTCFMSEVHIKRWTALAMEFGVEFDGKFGYKLPKQGYKDPEFSFRAKKALGLIPEHRRSDLAKIRRAARRGVKQACIEPVPVSSLFTTRYRLSAKDMRREWFWNFKSRNVSFTAYKSTVPKGQCLNIRSHRSEIPLAVYASISRMYQRPVLVPKPQSNVVSKPEVIPIRLPDSGKNKPIVIRAGAAVDFFTTTGNKSIFHSTIPRLDPSLLAAMSIMGDPRVGHSDTLRHSSLKEDFVLEW